MKHVTNTTAGVWHRCPSVRFVETASHRVTRTDMRPAFGALLERMTARKLVSKYRYFAADTIRVADMLSLYCREATNIDSDEIQSALISLIKEYMNVCLVLHFRTRSCNLVFNPFEKKRLSACFVYLLVCMLLHNMRYWGEIWCGSFNILLVWFLD